MEKGDEAQAMAMGGGNRNGEKGYHINSHTSRGFLNRFFPLLSRKIAVYLLKS